MYKTIVNDMGIAVQMVLRIGDRTWIPFDPANTDYQAYLAWVAEGNEPEPAEENT
jgi:hypothetical protein